MNRNLLFAISAARNAGVLLLSMRNSVKEVPQVGKDFLTDADQAADQLIRTALGRRALSIYSEEAPIMIGQVPTWVVDPLDGTVNYSHGLDNWGISIALIEADKVLEGVIFLPMQGRLMAAAAGRSHTPAVRGLESGVSATNNLGRSQVWTDWSKGDPGATLRILSILAQHTMYPQIRLCSTAAIVAVASGQIDAFVHPHPEIEDVAAGILIVEAAGGKATSLSGANWLNNPHEPIVFSNGVLHDRLLELLAAN